MMNETSAALAWKHKRTHSTDRRRCWYDPTNGHIADDHQQYSTIAPHAPLADVLNACDPDTLFILPGINDIPGWALAMKAEGIRVEPRQKTNSATIITADGETSVHPAIGWFDTAKSVSACAATWNALNTALADTWKDRFATLRSLPSATATDLIARSLPKNKAGDPQAYPVLDDDLLQLFLNRRFFGQAHIETLTHDQPTLTQVFDLDGVFMYAACLRSLPTGPVTHDTNDEHEPYVRGFYKVKVTIPADWRHIGLLRCIVPPKIEDYPLFPRGAGMTFHSWCSDMEYRHAIACGWKLEIMERVLWRERSSDPLKIWGERLVAIRSDFDGKKEPLRSMGRAALRNIVLQGIGNLARSETVRNGYAATMEDVPADVDHWEFLDNGMIMYGKREDVIGKKRASLQPHWADYIWAHARVRLHKAALDCDFNDIIALRTDGIWLAGPPPAELCGEGIKPGSWRVKHDWHGQSAWPRNNSDMLKLMALVTKEDSE